MCEDQLPFFQCSCLQMTSKRMVELLTTWTSAVATRLCPPYRLLQQQLLLPLGPASHFHLLRPPACQPLPFLPSSWQKALMDTNIQGFFGNTHSSQQATHCLLPFPIFHISQILKKRKKFERKILKGMEGILHGW